jgi:hypothetical protein
MNRLWLQTVSSPIHFPEPRLWVVSGLPNIPRAFWTNLCGRDPPKQRLLDGQVSSTLIRTALL